MIFPEKKIIPLNALKTVNQSFQSSMKMKESIFGVFSRKCTAKEFDFSIHTITSATPDGVYERVLCYKTFSVWKTRISSRIRNFSELF